MKFINISLLGAELVSMIQNANATQHESKETSLKCLQLQNELIKIEKKIDKLMADNGKYLMEINAVCIIRFFANISLNRYFNLHL